MATKKLVLLKKLREEFHVRDSIRPEHVEFLAGLIKGGTKLPPIKITPTMAIIDGRHRVAAYRSLGLKKIECQVVAEKDTIKLIALAVNENIGGSLSPTTSDLLYAIEQMINLGASRDVILGSFSMPPEMVGKLHYSVRLRLDQKRLHQAVTAISGGDVTAVEAAKKYGVKLPNLKAAIRGRRKKVEQNQPARLRKLVDKRFLRFQTGLVQQVRHLTAQCRHGATPWTSGNGVIKHTEDKLNRLIILWENLKGRYEVARNNDTGKK